MKPPRASEPRRRAAFTLIELLTVIAILAVLAAIGSRTLNAAKERSRIVQCRAELVSLAQALANYKRSHGDFPFGGSSLEISATRLFAAIVESQAAISSFATKPLDADRVVIDPWGTPYVYAYRTQPGDDWKPTGFLLFSAGPDATSAGPDASGRFEGGRHASPFNADNLYADDPP